MVMNGAMPTTAAPVKVATGTAIKTMLQIVPAVNSPLKIVEWGCSFDASAAATPGEVELVETGAIAGTVTAYGVNDVMLYGDPNGPPQTSGTTGIPLNLGTALSGFTATVEGSIVATREFDFQLLPPTQPYVKQFPLGREPAIKPGNVCRIRMTFGTTVNAYCYIVFET